MTKRRSEKGAVLILTVTILTFVVSLLAVLSSAVVFSSNFGSTQNKNSGLKRRLKNDCYDFAAQLDFSETVDENAAKIKLTYSVLVTDSLNFSTVDTTVSGGVFALQYGGYQADVSFSVSLPAKAVIAGLAIKKV